MTTTADGNVSVRAVAKTFASGKTEKLVHQTLAECDLPSGKVGVTKRDAQQWCTVQYNTYSTTTY